jgi:hypothetical protein
MVDLTGYTQPHVCNLMNGKRELTPAIQESLMRAAGIRIADLFTDEGLRAIARWIHEQLHTAAIDDEAPLASKRRESIVRQVRQRRQELGLEKGRAVALANRTQRAAAAAGFHSVSSPAR